MKHLFIVLAILITQSCQIVSLGTKDPRTIYINTTIPAYSTLKISTENAKSFSFEALIKSNSNIKLKTHDIEIDMEKDNAYALNVDDSESVNFTNSSNLNAVIKIKIFNHSAKAVETIAQL
jgi:hypothetical protein